MEVPKSLFLPFLPLQLMLAGFRWSHGTNPTTCSSLSYGVSSGGASLWLILGAWEQLEPFRKIFPSPYGNGQHWDSASQGLHLHESSQPGTQQGRQLCLPHQSTAACPHLPLLLSMVITSTFRREDHPPNGLGGLGIRAAPTCRGTSAAVGAMRVLEEEPGEGCDFATWVPHSSSSRRAPRCREGKTGGLQLGSLLPAQSFSLLTETCSSLEGGNGDHIVEGV